MIISLERSLLTASSDLPVSTLARETYAILHRRGFARRFNHLNQPCALTARFRPYHILRCGGMFLLHSSPRQTRALGLA